MPTVNNNIEITVPWNERSSGHSALLLDPITIKESYLWGIPLCNVSTGVALKDEIIALYIRSAQTFVEDLLGLKFGKQYIEETKDFVREEFFQFGYLKTSWNILKPCSLSGQLNDRTVIDYPIEWLTTRSTNLGVDPKWKNLYIVPNGAATTDLKFLAVSYAQWFSFYGAARIPKYWKIGYISGFDRVPENLITLVGKIAALNLLPIVEQIAAGNGVSYGNASSSLSIDGMSQSVSKANGGNIFQQRIKQYWDEIKNDLPLAKTMYVGITFDVA